MHGNPSVPRTSTACCSTLRLLDSDTTILLTQQRGVANGIHQDTGIPLHEHNRDSANGNGYRTFLSRYDNPEPRAEGDASGETTLRHDRRRYDSAAVSSELLGCQPHARATHVFQTWKALWVRNSGVRRLYSASSTACREISTHSSMVLDNGAMGDDPNVRNK